MRLSSRYVFARFVFQFKEHFDISSIKAPTEYSRDIYESCSLKKKRATQFIILSYICIKNEVFKL